MATLEISIPSPFNYPGPFAPSYIDYQWESSRRRSVQQFQEFRSERLGEGERWTYHPWYNPQQPGRDTSQNYMSAQHTGQPPVLAATTSGVTYSASDPSSRPQSSNAAPPSATHETTHYLGDAERSRVGMGSAMDSGSQGPPYDSNASVGRVLGLHNVLNHPQPDLKRAGKQIAGSAMSRSAAETVLHEGHPPSLSPMILKRPGGASPAREAPSPGMVMKPGRRVLTAKSPRMASATAQRIVSAITPGSAGRRPGDHRGYTVEPGASYASEVPPLPAASSLHQYRSPFIATSDMSPVLKRRFSAGRGSERDSGSSAILADASRSHSPRSSYSQPSPVINYSHPGYSHPEYQVGRRQSTARRQGSQIANMGSAQAETPTMSGQYMLGLDGGAIPLEINRTQASHSADEKRRRNAGASARFRERRKQKEKEAAHAIESYELKLKDVTEERNFYQSERDYMRDFIVRNMGSTALAPRPASPARARRLPVAARIVEAGPPNYVRSPDTQHGSLRNPKQRRTGEYMPVLGTPASMHSGINTLPHPSSGGFYTPSSQRASLQISPPYAPPPPPPSFRPGMEQLPPIPLQPQQQPIHYAASGPPLQPQRSTSYDPFRQGNYDKSWNPAR